MYSSGLPVDPDRLFGNSLFERLDYAKVTAIASRGWTVGLRRGEHLLERGAALEGLYVVLNGNLKLYMLSCNGDERVLRILQEGDSFGEAIMFNGFPSPVFVDAMTHVELAYFPRDVISEALTANPEFTTSMLQNMSALMRNLIQDLETCCLQNALQRTVNYLLREALNAPPPHVGLTMPAPKAVVASMLNMSAETFSRELHRLQDHGLIEIDRRMVRLRDRHALAKLSETGALEPTRRRARQA